MDKREILILKMTEDQILTVVTDYLRSRKYNPKRIDANALPPGIKSTDYEVYSKGSLEFYCEVKSPLLLANTISQMFHWTTSISKIRNFIHDSIAQFIASDSLHNKPWVLVFTSDHMQLNWTNMCHAITGIVGYGTTIIKDLKNERYVKDTEEDVRKIDLFVWFQMNKNREIHQVRFFINVNSLFKQKDEEIVELLKPLPNEKAYKK